MTTPGTDAAAAGIPVATGLENANTLHVLINLVADEVARRTASTMPVNRGGTGATTPEGARAALGADNAANLTSGALATDRLPVVPTAKLQQASWDMGGGSTLKNLHTESSGHGWFADLAVNPGLAHLFGALQVDGGAGFANNISVGGPIVNPHGRANPVTTGWVAAAFNSDGRIAIQPSAERWKQDIVPRRYTLAQAATIGRLVVQYRLIAAVERDGDGAPVEVGIIADRLLAAGFPEFVVLDADREPLSIRYDQMVVVALSALADVATDLAEIRAMLAGVSA